MRGSASEQSHPGRWQCKDGWLLASTRLQPPMSSPVCMDTRCSIVKETQLELKSAGPFLCYSRRMVTILYKPFSADIASDTQIGRS